MIGVLGSLAEYERELTKERKERKALNRGISRANVLSCSNSVVLRGFEPLT
nr:hypothetical protein [Mycobacterium kubicae]